MCKIHPINLSTPKCNEECLKCPIYGLKLLIHTKSVSSEFAARKNLIYTKSIFKNIGVQSKNSIIHHLCEMEISNPKSLTANVDFQHLGTLGEKFRFYTFLRK